MRRTAPELTAARELEVLRHIVASESNAEIGGALFITEATVKAHVNSILNKLDVSDSNQAVTTALKRGIVLPRRCTGPCPGTGLSASRGRR